MSFIDQVLSARLFGGNNRYTTPPINPSPNINTIPDGGYNAGNLLPTGGVRPQIDVGLMGKNILNAVSRARDALATPEGFEEAGKRAVAPTYALQKSLRPYAVKWHDSVKNNSAIQKIINQDPIIGGIIEVESKGGKHILSPKGARGVMQLMPNTYRRTWDPDLVENNKKGAYRYGRGMRGKWLDEDQVAIPEENVKFGAEYYNKLKQDKNIGNGSDRQALIAYNWGPKNYRKWKSRGGKESQLPPETRDYLAKIEKVMNKKLR